MRRKPGSGRPAAASRPCQSRSVAVRTEAAFVTVAGLVAGAAGGWLLSQMLVKVLTGVFDPPPSALAVPWAYLAVVGGVAVVAIALAARRTVRSAQAPDATMVRGL
jgi:putative ABC transport system permease protein